MENQEYIIISKTAIQKRIEELEKQRLLELKDDFYDTLYLGEINSLKQILSQSTPLVPEIDKAYDAGIKDKELSQMFDNPKGRYVYNLKLDI